YQIGETFEAGLALTGTEVKSLRGGKATIAEAYADSRGGEIWLVNANIPEYLQGGRFNHAPKRVRKLLLHRRQINKLMAAGRGEAGGNAVRAANLLFQEEGRRQARAGPRARQEAARQARNGEEAQLGGGARPAVAGQGVIAAPPPTADVRDDRKAKAPGKK